MKILLVLALLGLILVQGSEIPRVLQAGRFRRPEQCNADGSCNRDRHICLTLYNICIRVRCTDNTHCPTNKVCTNNNCVSQPCTSDSDCASGSFCHPDLSQCKVKLCSADADCTIAPRTVCDLTYFYCKGSTCATDADCNPSGGSSYFCNADSECKKALCTTSPDNCPSNFQCDAATRRCSRVQCDAANEATICNTPTEFCHISSGLCLRVQCTADTDCRSDQVCSTEFKKCIPAPCTLDTDCRGNLICDTNTGKCRKACTVDADCRNSNLVCTNAACVPKSCTQDIDCSGNWPFPPRCSILTNTCVSSRRRGRGRGPP